MTSREEIERLLNQAGWTLDGLPELYSIAQCEDAIKRIGLSVGMAGNAICHQSDVIERLIHALRDTLEKAPKWISVDVRLPEYEKEVLCYLGNSIAKSIVVAFVRDGEWRFDGWPCPTVTHWMPLPEPPKEE